MLCNQVRSLEAWNHQDLRDRVKSRPDQAHVARELSLVNITGQDLWSADSMALAEEIVLASQVHVVGHVFWAAQED